MTKTEACWDRTEGCCMTDAIERGMRRPKRTWGNAPVHLFKTPAGCWHWSSRINSTGGGCQPTMSAALDAIAEHLSGKDAP